MRFAASRTPRGNRRRKQRLGEEIRDLRERLEQTAGSRPDRRGTAHRVTALLHQRESEADEADRRFDSERKRPRPDILSKRKLSDARTECGTLREEASGRPPGLAVFQAPFDETVSRCDASKRRSSGRKIPFRPSRPPPPLEANWNSRNRPPMKGPPPRRKGPPDPRPRTGPPPKRRSDKPAPRDLADAEDPPSAGREEKTIAQLKQ